MKPKTQQIIGGLNFEPVAERDNWWRVCAGQIADIPAPEGYDLEGWLNAGCRAALGIQSEASAQGFTAIYGADDEEEHTLYLVPTIDPVEVARLFRVGSRDDHPPGHYAMILEQLSESNLGLDPAMVEALLPMAKKLADNPPDFGHAAFIRELAKLNKRNPVVPFFADCAGYCCQFTQPLDDKVAAIIEDKFAVWGDPMFDDQGCVVPFIKKHGFMNLFWD